MWVANVLDRVNLISMENTSLPAASATYLFSNSLSIVFLGGNYEVEKRILENFYVVRLQIFEKW